MKTVKMGMMTVLLGLTAPPLFAQPNNPEPPNQDKIVSQIKADLEKQYGMKVECDRSLYGLAGSLTVENCLSGMTRLQAALKNVNPPLKWHEMKELSNNRAIMLSGDGRWQGLTAGAYEVVIPFNATPEAMTKFVTSELKLAFDTSLTDIVRANDMLARRIRNGFTVNVTSAPEISVLQANEGLRKLELALSILYSGKNASDKERERLGFETIVLGSDDSRLYEDKGELRMDVKFSDPPGKMFEELLHSMPHQSEQVTPWEWTYPESLAFRDDRARVDAGLKTLKQKLGGREIVCALDSKESGNVTMGECLEGLRSVQKALETVKPQEIPSNVQKIVISDMFVQNYSREDLDQNKVALHLHPKIEPATAAEVLKANE